jgi:hypothetical protein
MALSLFQFALIFIIVLLIYQVIIQTLIYLRQNKKSSFGAVTTELTVVLPNEKNVVYMIIKNPYTSTMLNEKSSVDKIDEFNKSVTDLQNFKKELINDIYSVDNFIKSVLVNYNYTFDNSVTTLVDFSKESLIKSFELGKKMWALCGNKTYKDAINYLFTDPVMLQMYMESIRKRNLVIDGQANNPVISDNSFSDVTTARWGKIMLLRGKNDYSPVFPYASGASQAFALQRVRSISQSIKLSAGSYTLSTFCSARKNDATRGELPMYVYNDTSNAAQVVKVNPIEVSLSLTESTTKEESFTSTTTSKPVPTTTKTVQKINLQTLQTTTVSISFTETKKITLTTTVTKSIIGVIIPKTSLTWQQDLLVFDIPKESTYELMFTGTWSADDRTSFLTDIILSDVTPFDFLPSDYKCKKPSLDTNSQYVKSTREDDYKNILSFYNITEKMSVTGNDLSTTTGATVTQCKSLCDVNSACGGFIFDNSSSTCSLKTGVVTPAPIKNDNTTLYKKVDKSTYSQFANRNAAGNDILNFVNPATNTTDVNACSNACDVTEGCKAFVQDRTTKRCFLKSDIGTTTTTTTTDIFSKNSTINAKLTPSKFTNPRTGSFGNVIDKFGVVTNYPDSIPVNPYLNKYIQFADGTFAFVYANGTLRRMGTDAEAKLIEGVNGCPNANYRVLNNKLFRVNFNDVKLFPLYDPPIVEGSKMVAGDSCFVDGSKVKYINEYMPVQSNKNAPGNDIGNRLTNATVESTMAECNKNSRCAGFVYDRVNKFGYLKNNVNIPQYYDGKNYGFIGGGQVNVDIYRRKAVDDKNNDMTYKTEVNPFLNSYLYQKDTSYSYVTSDGEIFEAWGRNNNNDNPGVDNCPWGKVNDSDGRNSSLQWLVVGSDPTKIVVDPPLKDSTKTISITGLDRCAVTGKTNPFLLKYIRMSSGTMYYVTDDGTMRKIPTWYVLDSIGGKNGCPLSSDYVQVETDDYTRINTLYKIKPPLKLGQDLVFGDYCKAPVTNSYLGKIIQFQDGTYAYITTLGLVRRIPTTDVLNSIVGKNGCPLSTTITKVNTDDYNTLGVFTPPLLPGSDMTYNDYCTGFTPVLTDVSKLKLNTVQTPYTSLYFDDSIKASEVYLVLNGQYLKLSTSMTSEQRKSEIYDFITKNYF